MILETRVITINHKSVYGRTPLIEACISGSKECVQSLIEAGANVNIFNKYQNTPLHVASVNNQIAIVEILLANRADIMRRNYVRLYHH